MNTPKEINRADVLGELQHRWYGDGDPQDMIRWTLDELVQLDILRYREPAGDPSKDLVGTVRRDELTGRTAHKLDSDGRPWAEYTAGFTSYDWIGDEDVAAWPVIGAVPGTPAAEQQEPSLRDWLDKHNVTEVNGEPLPPLPDPHEPVVLKRADTAPPQSAYSKHLRHQSPEPGCEYCPPEVIS